MSWNIRLASKSKAALVTAVQAQTQVPQGFKDMIVDQVNACAEPVEGEVLLLDSNGHIDSPAQASSYGTGGEGKFRVYLVCVIGGSTT